MEENQTPLLFGLSIDQTSKSHLSEAARWAKFLAIVGFVTVGLLILGGIFAGSIFSMMGSRLGAQSNPSLIAGMGGMLAFIYIIIALVYFFPCLFLYRFANKMKLALASNDQETINSSFQNLKIMFRYVGIMMIIVFGIYLIIFLFGMLAAGFGR